MVFAANLSDVPLANLQTLPSDNDDDDDKETPQLSPFSATDNGVPRENVGTDTVIAIVGVGFVGESLLSEFSKVFDTIGYDTSRSRIEELQKRYQAHSRVRLSCEGTDLFRATHYLICVPTLLRPDRSVNVDYVHAAICTVLNYARPGCTIILESSVAVGTTREMLGPYRHIFNCGMSPERVDPGRITPTVVEIPKIVSGLGGKALKQIQRIYEKVFETVVPVSTPEVAEMTKLFENCYRMVNIAYVNEISDACRKWKIDPKEMINAASTKPYGFQAFYPGLGVGGHCIPVNPFYLLTNNNNLPVLERSTKLMWSRPKKLAKSFYRRCASAPAAISSNSVARALSKSRSPRILVVGVGFKPGQAVLSCSPGISFAESLKLLGCTRLAFYDPLVQQNDVPWMEKLVLEHWNTAYIDREFDGVAVCTEQQCVEMSVLDGLARTLVKRFV